MLSWFRRGRNSPVPATASSWTHQNGSDDEFYGVTDKLIEHVKSFTVDTFKNSELPEDASDEASTSSGGMSFESYNWRNSRPWPWEWRNLAKSLNLKCQRPLIQGAYFLLQQHDEGDTVIIYGEKVKHRNSHSPGMTIIDVITVDFNHSPPLPVKSGFLLLSPEKKWGFSFQIMEAWDWEAGAAACSSRVEATTRLLGSEDAHTSLYWFPGFEFMIQFILFLGRSLEVISSGTSHGVSLLVHATVNHQLEPVHDAVEGLGPEQTDPLIITRHDYYFKTSADPCANRTKGRQEMPKTFNEKHLLKKESQTLKFKRPNNALFLNTIKIV
ncbi:hypothetical protein AKJ16_DCAP08733 [Drosera capensis]